MITDIIIFPNGMVAVCNHEGKQIPSLQGRWSNRKLRITLMYLMKKYPDIQVRGNLNQTPREWEKEEPFWFPYHWQTPEKEGSS